jgi:hypothetical protein
MLFFHYQYAMPCYHSLVLRQRMNIYVLMTLHKPKERHPASLHVHSVKAACQRAPAKTIEEHYAVSATTAIVPKEH